MPNIAFEIAEKRVNAANEIVEAWKRNYDEAMESHDVQQVAGEIAALIPPLRRFVDVALAAEDEMAPEELWRFAYSAGSLVNKTAELFEVTEVRLAKLLELGYEIEIEGVVDFRRGEGELVGIKERLFKAWPLPERGDIEKAEAGIATGDCSYLE